MSIFLPPNKVVILFLFSIIYSVIDLSIFHYRFIVPFIINLLVPFSVKLGPWSFQNIGRDVSPINDFPKDTILVSFVHSDLFSKDTFGVSLVVSF